MIEFIFIFVFSCIILALSGKEVIKSLTNIAKILNWHEFAVATILMAFASSLPELFVGVSASLARAPQLAVGNILGSNIVLLTLVVGVGVIFAKKIEFKGETIKKAKIFACFFTIFPLILIFDGYLSRVDGLTLLASFLLYLSIILKEQKKLSKIFDKIEEKSFSKIKRFFKELLIFLFSTGLLLLSAQGIVFASEKIVSFVDISLVIIGILGIALGTSLPEIAFGIRAITTGHKEMYLGNLIGSIGVNSGFILGVVALIAPFQIAHFSLYFNAIVFSFLASSLFLIFSLTKNKISRKEGLVLLLVYLLFFLIESFLEFSRP